MSKTKKTASPFYELLYIVSNKFTEDEVGPIVEKIEGFITNNEGKITYRENWGKKKMAYPIKGFAYGYYLYVEFDSKPEAITKIDRSMRMLSEIVRHQLIRRDVRTADLPEKPKPIIEPEIRKEREVAAKEEVAVAVEEPKAVAKPKKAKVVENKADLKELDEKLDKILETNDLL